jgi:hypothetical protein
MSILCIDGTVVSLPYMQRIIDVMLVSVRLHRFSIAYISCLIVQ